MHPVAHEESGGSQSPSLRGAEQGTERAPTAHAHALGQANAKDRKKTQQWNAARERGPAPSACSCR